TPDSVRRTCSGVRLARRPSVANVVEEAGCTHFGTGPASPDFSVAVSAAPSSLAPGAQVSVTVSNQVDLGLTGLLLSVVGIDESYASPTLSATAVAIEE
ncbi:MAG TPA: hypothetical protein VNC78_11695, partial [Actinomycetota bacterium]|nr:hypothetical protein [Actinomycetota bacterium]